MSSNVAKLLGFKPTDFYDEIASSIDTQIDNQIENFAKELLTVRLMLTMRSKFGCCSKLFVVVSILIMSVTDDIN